MDQEVREDIVVGNWKGFCKRINRALDTLNRAADIIEGSKYEKKLRTKIASLETFCIEIESKEILA